jgi:hypothetical protein
MADSPQASPPRDDYADGDDRHDEVHRHGGGVRPDHGGRQRELGVEDDDEHAEDRLLQDVVEVADVRVRLRLRAHEGWGEMAVTMMITHDDDDDGDHTQ